MNEPFSLEGKLVAFVLSGSPESPWFTLQDAKIETIAGRLFVTGTVPGPHSESWMRGLTAAVAWDSVQYYVLFSSEEDYKSRVSVALKPQQKRFFGRKNE
jgi:hypothetical protein